MAASGPYSIVLLFEDQANSLLVAPPLKEKGLDVHVVATAAELIQIIAVQKFDLVCLSVNHPSATSLVQVLKIKTHVAVLVFGEDQSTETSRAVLKTAADYQITGTISSYNIWMKIGHLVKEKQRQIENASRMLSNRFKEQEGNTVVKSSGSKPTEPTGEAVGKVQIKAVTAEKKSKVSVISEERITVKSSSNEDKITVKSAILKKEKKILMGAKKKAPKLQIEGQDDVEVITGPVESDAGSVAIKEDATPIHVTALEVKSEKPAPKGKLLKKAPKSAVAPATPVTVQVEALAPAPTGKVKVEESVAPAKSAKSFRPVGKIKKPEKRKENLSEDEQIDREIDQLQNLFFETDPNVIGLGEANVVEDNNATDNSTVDLHNEEATSRGTVELKAKTHDDDRGTVRKSIADALENGAVVVEEQSSYQTEEARILSIEAARAHRKKIKEKSAQKAEAALKIGTKEHLLFKKIFREAVAKAGEKSLKRSENTHSIGAVTKVSLIPVDNVSERGFIIVANNANDFSPIDEISGFKETLNSEMNGVKTKHEFVLGDTYNIETLEVDVAAWAERSSQFFYTFENPDSGKQVLICFLKREDLFPETCHMESQRMYRIDIHEVPSRVPVSFDAYLFLARNDKMLPYLRRGGFLTGKQIQRLYQRGFKFLYLKDEDVRDYYEFYFSFALNQDFRSAKKFA